jgi:hypothetical protein
MGTRCTDHVTPLYPQKLALTSPTGGGRSVSVVCLRTKGDGVCLFAYAFIVFSHGSVPCKLQQTSLIRVERGRKEVSGLRDTLQ